MQCLSALLPLSLPGLSQVEAHLSNFYGEPLAGWSGRGRCTLDPGGGWRYAGKPSVEGRLLLLPLLPHPLSACSLPFDGVSPRLSYRGLSLHITTLFCTNYTHRRSLPILCKVKEVCLQIHPSINYTHSHIMLTVYPPTYLASHPGLWRLAKQSALGSSFHNQHPELMVSDVL